MENHEPQGARSWIKRENYRYPVIALSVMLLLLLIEYLGFFQGMDHFFFDLSFRMRGPRPPGDRVVIAVIDDKTLGKLGRWPIDRRNYARLLDRTKEAAVVGFDIIMAEPSDHDRIFAQAIKKHGKVVLATYVSAGGSAVFRAPERFPARVGHVHIEQDIDGKARKIFHSLYIGNSTLPSMASVIYELATGTKYRRSSIPSEISGRLSARAIIQADPMILGYYGAPRTFRYISLVDILSDAYPQSFFKNRIVLVGASAAGIPENHLTPFSWHRKRMAAVELQATAVNNLLDGTFIRKIPAWGVRLLALALFGILVTGINRRALSVWLWSLTLISAFFFLSFSMYNLWVDPTLPYVSVTFACAVSHLFRLDEMARKLDREYARIASRLGWAQTRPGPIASRTGLPGFISLKGIDEKVEMLVKLAEELLKTYRELETESSERIRTVEVIREQEKILIHQSRMAAMGEMLNNIAHQWRQPLNVLGLTLQQLGLLYETGQLNKEQLDTGITKAMEILLHLSQTIDDFRNFSVPDKEKNVFRVHDSIRKTISLIEESFSVLGIVIETDVAGEPTINGYVNEFGQVILNILMNARDAFVERGRSEPRIMVKSWEEEKKAVVTITDNAGGIDESIMGRIFDAYFTTKELGKGTGVGLFMSKAIIEKNMGGSLSARNTGDGVEFRIEV